MAVVINSGENWIPGELYNEQRGHIEVKGKSKCLGGGSGREVTKILCWEAGVQGMRQQQFLTLITKKEHKQVSI